MTVRLMLVLTILEKLHSQQIDFISVFTQAPLNAEVYMHSSDGSNVTVSKNRGLFLKLLKNIYGLKQAGRNWWETLRQSLID